MAAASESRASASLPSKKESPVSIKSNASPYTGTNPATDKMVWMAPE